MGYLGFLSVSLPAVFTTFYAWDSPGRCRQLCLNPQQFRPLQIARLSVPCQGVFWVFLLAPKCFPVETFRGTLAIFVLVWAFVWSFYFKNGGGRLVDMVVASAFFAFARR